MIYHIHFFFSICILHWTICQAELAECYTEWLSTKIWNWIVHAWLVASASLKAYSRVGLLFLHKFSTSQTFALEALLYRLLSFSESLQQSLSAIYPQVFCLTSSCPGWITIPKAYNRVGLLFPHRYSASGAHALAGLLYRKLTTELVCYLPTSFLPHKLMPWMDNYTESLTELVCCLPTGFLPHKLKPGKDYNTDD